MLICTLKKLHPSTSTEINFMATSTSMHKAIVPFHRLLANSFCNEITHSPKRHWLQKMLVETTGTAGTTND